MQLRLATEKDLPKLKNMYDKIVDNLNKNNINIYWSEWYPYEEFEIDIPNNNLYLLTKDNSILAAFGLYDMAEGQECFSWQQPQAKAKYLARIGVSVDALRQGIGGQVVSHAATLAKNQGAQYLRLQVVDVNIPAINLYKKNGFSQVEGVHREYLEYHKTTLTEYGFELKL